MKTSTFFSMLLALAFTTQIVIAQDVRRLEFIPFGKLVKISVDTNFTSTGVNIQSGDKIVILVDGIATTEKNSERLYNWVGPEGPGSFQLNGLPVHSVIGKIGSSGIPFHVGRGTHFEALKSGELFLGYNDNVFTDNLGTFVAYIISPSTGGPNSVQNSYGEIPDNFELRQNYPNPFNPGTTIEYQLFKRGNVEIKIYNSLGQIVKTLLHEQKQAGRYSVIWNGQNDAGNMVTTGTYFYQIKVGDFIQSKKMLLLK